MKNDNKESNTKITDYFKLRPYEKKPFYVYPLFLLILVPIFLTPETESELLYDRIVIAAFVIAIITTGISFWMIHDKRKGEILGITATIKETKTNVIIECYHEKEKPCSFETTDREEIIKEINKEIMNIRKRELTEEEIELIEFEIKDEEENRKVSTKIFSVLYGLVAALAITNALDFFVYPTTDLRLPSGITNVNFTTIDSLYEVNHLIISQEFIVLISFFVVGTFFYHCGLAFFSDQAAKMLNKKEKRRTAEAVLSGVILFTEGIFLYFAAGSIGSVLQFSLWIFFLMVVDVAWVLLNSDYLKRGYAQWIHFDIIMIIFFVAFLSYGDTELVQYYHYLIVFGVILFRIILDYKLSWQFFTKFSISG